MASNNKREIAALGYKWTLSENDVHSDYERARLEDRAGLFLHSGDRKPSAVAAIYGVMFPEYYDILSCVEKVEPINPSEEWLKKEKESAEKKNRLTASFLFLNDLLWTPASWFALVWPLFQEGQEEELKQLRALWEAAKELNPHWYPPNPMEDAPPEALATIAGVDAQLDPQNTTDFEPPEPEEVVAAANEIAASAEEKAKEAGLVGPSSFSSKGKGSGKQRDRGQSAELVGTA